MHVARASHCEQARDGKLALWTAASEADLAPLHSASEGALGSVVGGFHAFRIEERKEPFKVQTERRCQIPNVLVAAVEMGERQSKKLLLQWNRFQDQLFSRDRPIADAGSAAKAVPQAEKTPMQCEKIAAESSCLGCFRNLQHTQDVAFEMCPAELARSGMVFQISGTAVAAQDARECRSEQLHQHFGSA